MEPMDVLEKLLVVGTKSFGILETALGPWLLMIKSGQVMQRPIRTAVPATMTTRAADAQLSES